MPLQTNYSFTQSSILDDMNQQSEDGALDYLGYGTASAVLSGATGLVNTVIGIGETLGIADSSSYLDEGRVVTSFLGQDGGDFYLRHKEGVDFAGMILSSIVPGAAGVKALRLAQKAGIVTNPLRLSTNLRNGDILLDSPLVQAAKQEALSKRSTSLLNPEYLKAVGGGFKQQVMENIAFTAGTVLLNNQNATMNPDDLSYLDAAGSQLMEGLPFIGVGAALGTAIDALRIGGAVKRFAKDAENKVVYTTPEGKEVTAGALRNLQIPELQGRNSGDAIIALAAESKARKAVASNITVKDGSGAEIVPEEFQYAYNNIMDSRNILNNEFMKVAQEANKAGPEGFALLKGMFDDLANANADRKNVLAALETVQPITQGAVKNVDETSILQRKVWDKAATTMVRKDGTVDVDAFRSITPENQLAVATRMARSGTLLDQDVQKTVGTKYADVLKQVDPKLVKLYGNPIAALSRDADRLLKAEVIDEATHKAVVQYRSTAFVNTVTKEVRNKITPRVSDFGETKLVKSADFKTAQLYSPALGKTFKYNPHAYAEASTGNLIGDPAQVPKLQQLDVNFHIAHSIDVNYGRKNIAVDAGDIGQLERLHKDILADKGAMKALQENRITLNGAAATQAGIAKALIDQKSKLIANLQRNGFNSDDIAVAANVSEKVVLGEEPLNAASVMARSDFSKPEWLQVQYKERTIQDYNKDINDFTGQAQRDKLYETQKQMALQELGHAEFVQGLPTFKIDAVDELSNLEDRTGLLKRMNASFGSVRETAMYVGKQVNDRVRKIKQTVAEEYTAVLQKFNAPENGLLRAELELATNFLRTGDVVQLGGKLVYKHELRSVANQLGEEAGIEDVIAALPEGSFVDIGEDVAGVMSMWHKEQQAAAKSRSLIAEAYGTNKTFDPDVIRAPGVDLKQYRIVAFVRPTGGKAAQDPTKYMLYAQSQEELATKVAAIRRDLGDDYAIVQKGEDAEYFKALQEYEMGHEFRDLFADISKNNRGRTADILPSLGGDQSKALNEMISSTLRNREYTLRASVELQNAEAFERLRRYGDYVDSTEKGALVKNFTSRAGHIYTDTVALMLDLPSYKGQGMQLWNQVNTAVAQRGSKVVDFVSAQGTVIGEAVRGINRVFRSAVGKENTPKFQKDLDQEIAKINTMMEKQGFKTPLKDITDLVLQSSDPAVSSSLQDLSRSMSNLISLTLLRADPAHSFMQLTSSVVLSLPVLRELRQALPEVADKLTTVVHPTTGVKEPNIHKLYFKGVAKAFSNAPEHVQFREQLKERGIISDYIGQFLDTTDMGGFTGTHSLKQVQEKQSKIAEFVSKWSGHTASEEHARFALANAVKEMCVAKGIPEKEMWPIISNAVDKVHGNYIASQRPQLFNGVIGQNVGLFQTYFFNVMQHMTRHIGEGDKKALALMGGLQASMYGAQSIPGFNTLNSLVANATGADSDLYSITDANDPNSWSAYGMFGLASQAFGIDFSGRGNLNPRYASIVPTSFENLATVGTLTSAIGNLYGTVGMVADGNVSVGTALAHGLAHNGMNRPLQGLGTILQNSVTSGTGQVDFANANIDPAGNIAWGAMFARVIGARPMDEAITRSHFYRQASYDAVHRDKMAELGAVIQTGGVEDWGSFANDYAEAGGDLQQFNAFIMRHMQTASEGKLAAFRKETEADTTLSRAMTRMQFRDSLTPYWED